MELSTMYNDRQNKLTPGCFSAYCHCLVSTLDLIFKYKVASMLDSPYYARFYFNTHTHTDTNTLNYNVSKLELYDYFPTQYNLLFQSITDRCSFIIIIIFV